MRQTVVPRSLILLFALATLTLTSCSGDNNDYGNNPSPPANLELNSGSLATGASFSHTFASSGSFAYHCTIHPCMAHGTVTVAPAGQDSALVNILTPGGGCPGGYTPLTVSLKPGGTVRWLNQSVAHTVTSD